MKEVKLLPYHTDRNKEIEIIELGKNQNISTSVNTPYRTDFYQIIWFKKGMLTAQFDFEEIIFEPDTIVFLNKNKIQSYSAEGEVQADLILFTDTFYNKSMATTSHIDRCFLFSDLLGKSVIKAQNINFKAIKNLIFHEYYNHDDQFNSAILRNQLHSFVLLAEREIYKDHQLKTKSVELDLYLEFKHLLDEKYKEEKSVEYYCNQLNITEKRLYRAVTTVSSKTPKMIIHNKVILEAKWLLSDSNLTTKEISIELGFSEPTNFIKYFKKYTGKNPSAYSKAPQG